MDRGVRRRYAQGIIKLRPRPRMIINLFMFNHEIDMLDIRIHVLGDAVDYYVVCESNYTFFGSPKQLYLSSNLSAGFLSEHRRKIVLLRSGTNYAIDKDHWAPENNLRSLLWQKGRHRFKNLRDDDLFMLNDADEIPSREVMLFLKYHDGYREPIVLYLRWFVYGFFWENYLPSVVPSICTVAYLREVYGDDSNLVRRNERPRDILPAGTSTGTLWTPWAIRGILGQDRAEREAKAEIIFQYYRHQSTLPAIVPVKQRDPFDFAPHEARDVNKERRRARLNALKPIPPALPTMRLSRWQRIQDFKLLLGTSRLSNNPEAASAACHTTGPGVFSRRVSSTDTSVTGSGGAWPRLNSRSPWRSSLFDWLDAWLDVWESKNLTSGTLTKGTHGALRQTTRALVQITEYCFTELGLNYVLLGKIQTDSLEDRFGKYRQLAGSQYHISIRQPYEGENKLRLQSTLPTIPCEDERWEQLEKQVDTPRPSCNI
ncbi:hypothetical protein HPB47_022410 [Ixodes persulcatus]|uniref:Uncharacterized protein n=1 Tax=Ixodes persulcatus TaxID=34615 RepID=A0AC60Q9U0_IXOPE|nr:hypothetical protein HPB47_022410 [Ixodes persulcatus]